jgi:uncharacterized protein YraI
MFTMTSKIIFSIFIILFVNGCMTPSEERSVTTATVSLATPTLPSLPASSPSQTPLPPPPQPTVAPIEASTSTQINVRVEPSTASNILGIIPANTKVQILGKDPGGNWLQIIYPQGVEGKGWVTAQYVLTPNGSRIPVVGGDESNPNNGNIAIVQQQLNIRSGPGTGFNSLGTLNPQDVVNLIGKDVTGAWLQIVFRAGPDGKGWVNAVFVQAKGVENLPIITDAGQVVGTETPTTVLFTPTPTVIPAWMDNDSQNNPIASIVFEPLGTHTFIYTGDISVPTGDPEDWIQFIPDEDTVFASLDCKGNNLQINLLENGQPFRSQLACNDNMQILMVKASAVYTIHLHTTQTTDGLHYIAYTLTIQTSP